MGQLEAATVPKLGSSAPHDLKVATHMHCLHVCAQAVACPTAARNVGAHHAVAWPCTTCNSATLGTSQQARAAAVSAPGEVKLSPVAHGQRLNPTPTPPPRFMQVRPQLPCWPTCQLRRGRLRIFAIHQGWKVGSIAPAFIGRTPSLHCSACTGYHCGSRVHWSSTPCAQCAAGPMSTWRTFFRLV